MKLAFFVFILSLASGISCNNNADSVLSSGTADTSQNITTDPAKDWKLGIALWTFHEMSFTDALDKIDSTGLKYIEPIVFQRAGDQFKDSSISQLSTDGIEKLKKIINARDLLVKSIYIVGDSTIQSWKKQFDLAKQFNVSFVTTEPPLNMWDNIDSLAGVYGIKVAIHEHWKGPSHYWNPDTVLAAISGHSNFGACADLGHWPKSGIVPAEAIKKLNGHIINLHLRDIGAFNNPSLRDTITGKGVVNFPAVFTELKKQNFKGYIYIEHDAENHPDNLPLVLHTIAYYKQQLNLQ
ncbi:MAG: sugar phosphate isomerase/epimerase [Chitinophagaceae bacterium]